MLLESLNKFKRAYPDSQKVSFFITKFSNNETYVSLFTTLKNIYKANGITLLRADDHFYHEDLYTNIETYMHSCESAIAFFDAVENEDYNPNVAFEVGFMMSLKKPVCLLKNESDKTLHSDLMGKLYISVDPFNMEKLNKPLNKWLNDNNLCYACFECYITIKNDLFSLGASKEIFENVENGLKVLKRNEDTFIFKGVSRNANENTVFQFECNDNFLHSMNGYLKNGLLSKTLNQEVLSVSQFKNDGYKNYDYVHEVTTFQEGSKEDLKVIHVCRLSSIEGWSKEKQIANDLFKTKETNNLTECEVYICCKNGIMYFHSNFVINGFNYPTKINAYEGFYNLLEILKILITSMRPDLNNTDERLIISHCRKVRYIIDRSMINCGNQLKIDLDGARNIEVVG